LSYKKIYKKLFFKEKKEYKTLKTHKAATESPGG
jgi:hypothetical protein